MTRSRSSRARTQRPADEERLRRQSYLRRAPRGVGAWHAWQLTGGNGAGVKFIDVERGWTLDHDDLIAKRVRRLHGRITDSHRWHGTAVLGVVCAGGLKTRCIGIAPGVTSVGVVAHCGSLPSAARAIVVATSRLGFGDVLLVEGEIGGRLPVETNRACFEAIRAATEAGIVVVEPAGNGGVDLDRVRGMARDSGAILVGAGSSSRRHRRLPFSNHGRRVDCFAWGEMVYTAISDEHGATDEYTEAFHGTSSAAAIVAGVSLCVQGMALAAHGSPYSPHELRDIFKDPANGTRSIRPGKDRIGAMPDLGSISRLVPRVLPGATRPTSNRIRANSCSATRVTFARRG